eukprot:scaffold35756_cov58-Phaeocystis_antarctica.AAC.4
MATPLWLRIVRDSAEPSRLSCAIPLRRVAHLGRDGQGRAPGVRAARAGLGLGLGPGLGLASGRRVLLPGGGA